jgi:hypothetical protein
MIMVIVTPRAMDHALSAMLPRGAAIRAASDRVYRMYETTGTTPVGQEFRDIDGELLISSHSFKTKLDHAQRVALLASVTEVVQ